MKAKAVSKSKKKKQCHMCKKRLTLVFSVCRCKGIFCPGCSIPEVHCCTQIELIRKNSRDLLKQKLLSESSKAEKIADRL